MCSLNSIFHSYIHVDVSRQQGRLTGLYGQSRVKAWFWEVLCYLSAELGKQPGCVQNPLCHSVHTGL